MSLSSPSASSSSARRPARGTERFTALGVLVAINVVVFLVQVASAPFGDMTGGSLVEHGGLNDPLVDHGEWWRIVTSGFLHGSFAHLVGNLVALVILGGILTLSIGPTRMVLVYVAGLLGSALSVLMFDPASLTVGASGAIFGLAGGAVLVGWARKRPFLLGFAVLWVAYSLSSTIFVPGISQAGHLGGLVVGAVAGALLVDERAQLRSEAASTAIVAVLCVLLLAAALVV